MEGNKRAIMSFEKFKKSIEQTKYKSRAALGPEAYSVYSRFNNSVKKTFTLEDIKDIIQNGDPAHLRELSRFYYRTNGIYRNNINLLSTLSKYDNVVTPIYDVNKKIDKEKTILNFYNACEFIDDLNLPINFSRITRETLLSGIYYGILREDENKYTIQDLPIEFCRVRFKDFNDLDVVEFNLNYFMRILEEDERNEVVASFPKTIQQAYALWISNKLSNPWVEIPAYAGGVSFSFGDKTPLLISAIPDLYKMEDAIDRETRRDENELYKLLIQKMPIDNKGELVFELEEVADIHESVASMLQSYETIDVLTTFGETELESLQDSTAAAQSSDRIQKYKTSAYDSLGRSSILFNAEGSSSLAYSIQRDEALIFSLLQQYAIWIKYQINERFARPNLHFDFTFLPTTMFNQDKIQKQYFQGAQYGYSKMYAAAALGIKQTNQLSLMSFENELLKMHEKMIPLQSTYTTSGTAIAGETKKTSKEEKTETQAKSNDITNEGGRPSLETTERSEKTELNQDINN